MQANNEIGTIEPICELAAVAHEHGALFHTDAVQAIGHITVDVKALNVDLLSASAHKFNGPKGIGFLYVKKGTHVVNLIDGGSQERGMRAGTENVAGIVGMAVALKNNCEKLNENTAHIISLEKKLIADLDESGLDYVRNGAQCHSPGSISLSFKGADGEGLLHRLDLMGISVSTGSACDSKNTQVSHVLKAIKLEEKYARGTIRVSLGKDNTEECVKRIVEAIIRIIG
jgi:cysteine desulfurase